MLGVSDVLDILAIDLIGMVPDDESVVKSANTGEPLTLSGDSPAGQAFRNIASRIAGNDVPFLSLEAIGEGGGIFSKLKRAFGL
jgi:septum site-determining protein MinD